MSTYKGWQRDLLHAAKLPDTSHNRQFLSDWHAASLIDCALNPVDLTTKRRHSKDCKTYSGPRSGSIFYQAYAHSTDTRAAFAEQINSTRYNLIQKALADGNPYDTAKITTDDADLIETALAYWGSAAWGADYANIIAAGGPPPTLKAPQALKGWGRLQHAMNHELPGAIKASQHSRAAALRALDRARKVRL